MVGPVSRAKTKPFSTLMELSNLLSQELTLAAVHPFQDGLKEFKYH